MPLLRRTPSPARRRSDDPVVDSRSTTPQPPALSIYERFATIGRKASSSSPALRSRSTSVDLQRRPSDMSLLTPDPPHGRRSEGDEAVIRRQPSSTLYGTIVTSSGGIAPAPTPLVSEKRRSGSSAGSWRSASTTKGKLFLSSLLLRGGDGEGKFPAYANDALDVHLRDHRERDSDDSNKSAPSSDSIKRSGSVTDNRLRRPSSTFAPTTIGPGVGPRRLARSSSASRLHAREDRSEKHLLPRIWSSGTASSSSIDSPTMGRRASSALGIYSDSQSKEGMYSLGAEDPPTVSLKALSQLTGLPLTALTNGSGKAVERLTGIRVPGLERGSRKTDDGWPAFNEEDLLQGYRPQEPNFAPGSPQSPLIGGLAGGDGEEEGAAESPRRRSNSTEKTRRGNNGIVGVALTTDANRSAPAQGPTPNGTAPHPTLTNRVPPRRDTTTPTLSAPPHPLPDHHRPSDPTTYRRSVVTEGGYAAESERSFSRPVTHVEGDQTFSVVEDPEESGAGAEEASGEREEGEEEGDGEMFRKRRESAASGKAEGLGPLPVFRRATRKASSASTASDASFTGIHIRAHPLGDPRHPNSGDSSSRWPSGRKRRDTLNSLATTSASSLRTGEGTDNPSTATGVSRSRIVSDVPTVEADPLTHPPGLAEVNDKAWGQKERSRSEKKADRGIGSHSFANGLANGDRGRRAASDFGAFGAVHGSSSSLEGEGGNAKTLASLYMVCGLPKDPACWTLAQPEQLPAHLEGAVPRFWRPEVLGTTVSGQDADLLSAELDSSRRKHRSRTSTSNTGTDRSARPHHPQASPLGKEELARMQAKSMKLAFPREVEVIASTVQPPSTTHCFSFVIPPASANVTDAMGAIGQEWDLALATSSGTDTKGSSHTWYGACLTVWSHADRSRSEAIRRTAEEGSKAKSAAIARAVKAAAAGRKFGARLQAAQKSPMGVLPTPEGLAGRKWSAATSNSGTETDTEAFVSESEFEGPASRMPIAQVPTGTPFWLPYSLVLVSRLPVYNLMMDHLRISWARYHQAIGKHSQQMLKMLNAPAPRPGDLVKMPVGAGDSQTYFVAKMPSRGTIDSEGIEDVDFTMWPVFRCLSLEHIISIYEIGFSPMGRILFFSRYPVLLNMAVETFRHLLELRGWRGMCQSVVHARDVKIYLEDPGPYILGMNAQVRPIAANPPPEVMVVDLDTDSISCPKPYPHALSKGALRFKIERRLHEAIGTLSGARGVPSEFHEAFPGGRFRPFSQVEIRGVPSLAERLVPPPEWNWDQRKVVAAFDAIVAELPRGPIAKMFKRRSYRQAPVLDASARHVQDIVRRHASGFVDRRDMLETKIWKLNRRLTFLMSESMEWKTHFETFQKFTDKLSSESQDLKTRLENERRNHRRLSGVVNEQQAKQIELEHRLLETEHAMMAAQVELAKAHELRDELERQKGIMVSEMKSIALAGDHSLLMDDMLPRMYAIDEIPSRPGTSTSNHASLTTRNLHRISTPGRPLSQASLSPQTAQSGSDELGSSERDLSEEGSGSSERREEEEQAKSRSAVIETMRSIQARLESTLRHAGLLDEEELKGYDVGSPTSAPSRRSAGSRESKIITLQRGRRKPNHSLDITPGSSSASLDSGSNGPSPQTPYSPLMGRQFAKPSGVALNRSKADPRMSAISLLTPGQSIFEGRPVVPRQSLNGRAAGLGILDDDGASDTTSIYDDATDAASFFSAMSYTPVQSPELTPVDANNDSVIDLFDEMSSEPQGLKVQISEEEDYVPQETLSSPPVPTRNALRPPGDQTDRNSMVSIASSQATVRGRGPASSTRTLSSFGPRPMPNAL